LHLPGVERQRTRRDQSSAHVQRGQAQQLTALFGIVQLLLERLAQSTFVGEPSQRARYGK